MLVIETQKYIRKPLYVNAVRVTQDNFAEVTVWCEGAVEAETGGPRVGQEFIKVNVHGVPKSQRQTKAFVGDWLLHTERGFKVYTDNAFRSSFDSVPAEGGEKVIQNLHLHSVGPVAEDPDPSTGVGEIESVEPAEDVTGNETSVRTGDNTAVIAGNKAGPITPPPGVAAELVRAPIVTPTENVVTPAVSDSDTAPPPQTVDGRRVITAAEQSSMKSEEVGDLLRSGEAVLEQDLV